MTPRPTGRVFKVIGPTMVPLSSRSGGSSVADASIHRGHQSGITNRPPEHCLVAAFDLAASDPVDNRVTVDTQLRRLVYEELHSQLPAENADTPRRILRPKLANSVSPMGTTVAFSLSPSASATPFTEESAPRRASPATYSRCHVRSSGLGTRQPRRRRRPSCGRRVLGRRLRLRARHSAH